VLRWELAADGERGCLLVFTHVFHDRDDAAALGAGWHAGLDLLDALLDGQPATGPANVAALSSVTASVSPPASRRGGRSSAGSPDTPPAAALYDRPPATAEWELQRLKQHRNRLMTPDELVARLTEMGIRQKGDPILHQPAKPFELPREGAEAEALSDRLLSYVPRLRALYKFSKGVGLAARQIGVSRPRRSSRTGVPWRDLPECFGDWKNTHKRFFRWVESGVWESLFKTLGTIRTTSTP